MSLFLHNGETGSATLSTDRKYRYRLTRRWEDGPGSRVVWVMLNPSTADHEKDDATIRRVVGFSKRLGVKSLVVVNLFAYRATDPKELLRVEDPVGSENASILKESMLGCDTAIVAWGALSKKLWMKAKGSLAIVEQFRLRCLGKTQAGAPRHPLYLSADRELEFWP